MDKHEIDQVLHLHTMWLNNDSDGRRANLSRADLRSANLRSADLRSANLRSANLRSADLCGADLCGADLCGANLSGANLSRANLRDADLRGADLRRADLRRANLSGTTGLLSPQYWLDGFDTDDLGILVFKKIGSGNTDYAVPLHWTIEPESVLSEECSPTRTIDCGCGVNFGTRSWCESHYQDTDLWLCRIRWMDLAGVVVPYNTDGKARCNRLELVENLGRHNAA